MTVHSAVSEYKASFAEKLPKLQITDTVILVRCSSTKVILPMMKIKWQKVPILFLGLMFAIDAVAEPVRVLTEHLPPYQIDTHTAVSGFATDVVRRTFEHAGIPYQIEVQDWSRAYQRTLRQKNTCIYSISKSIERTPLFQWVGELAYTMTAMYSLKSRADIQLQQLEDAKKFVTAVTKDDITHHYLLKHGFKEGEHFYVLENVALMLKVLQGRKNIDLVLVNDTILKYRTLESGVPMESLQKKLELTDLPLDFHLACSLTTSKDLVARLRVSLQQMKESGEFAEIIAGWANKLK